MECNDCLGMNEVLWVLFEGWQTLRTFDYRNVFLSGGRKHPQCEMNCAAVFVEWKEGVTLAGF